MLFGLLACSALLGPQEAAAAPASPFDQVVELEFTADDEALIEGHGPTQVVEYEVLFDGTLPDFNVGTNLCTTCAIDIEVATFAICDGATGYTSILNGRFKGGYITRHYGDPGINIHALQLEISQRTYMDENTGVFDDALAGQLRETLQQLISGFLRAASH